MINENKDNQDDYSWIIKNMHERRNDFIEWNAHKIIIRTWNVKTSFCENENDLYKWIFHNYDNHKIDNEDIDIIVVGLQEIINLNNPLSSTLDLLSSSQTNYWEEKFLKVINNNATYNVLSKVNCVGMCMFLFVKQDICHRISGIIIHIYYNKSSLHHYRY